MKSQENKTCNQCNETKPLDCFNKNQGKCKPCQKQYKAEWDKANKEHLKEYGAQWRQANPEYNAEWQQANKEQILEQRAEWRTKVPPGVYQVINKQTGKRYIGESEVPNDRRSKHWSYLRGGYHKNPNLQQDYNKYGEDAFEFEIIEHCDPSQLKQRETFWIKKHKDCCYNVYKV